ncbi:hypothetical protein ABK040_006190 [Willaertia magna]
MEKDFHFEDQNLNKKEDLTDPKFDLLLGKNVHSLCKEERGGAQDSEVDMRLVHTPDIYAKRDDVFRMSDNSYKMNPNIGSLDESDEKYLIPPYVDEEKEALKKEKDNVSFF